MSESLIHRGPDGERVFDDEHVSLAMRRLSIIDIDGGWQPFFSADKRYTVIANAEIYNYKELQASLQSRGIKLVSNCDVEVIVHLFALYGTEAFSLLRGMFAIAIWDSLEQELFLARDRMGEKPLFYLTQKDTLVFASEVLPLSNGTELKGVSPEAFNEYCYLGFTSGINSGVVEGIKRLPAGSYARWSCKQSSLEIKSYWSMENCSRSGAGSAGASIPLIESIKHAIVNATQADVPVCIALSGGLDSALVAAVAASNTKIECAYTIGYKGDEAQQYDERPIASSLASSLGIRHQEIEICDGDLEENFPHYIRSMDAPFADITGFAYFCLMRRVHSNGHKVLLTGHGGDEILWGYPWMRQGLRSTQAADRLRTSKAPGWWEQLMLLGAGLSPGNRIIDRARQLRNFPTEWALAKSLLAQPAGTPVFYELMPQYKEAFKVFGKLCITRAETAALPNIERCSSQAEIQRLVASLYLSEVGIAQSERLASAFSIELRLPLLDHVFIENALGRYRDSHNAILMGKAILRNAIADILPPAYLNHKKRPFSPPIRRWKRIIFTKWGSLLRDGRLVTTGLLPATIASAFSLQGSMTKISDLAYALLVFELWMRENDL